MRITDIMADFLDSIRAYEHESGRQYILMNLKLNKMSKEKDQNKALSKADVSGSSIRIPKPCLKFEGLDNLSIVSENPIPLSDLFELHLKLENYLKTRPETIVNNDGLIVGFKNGRVYE